MKHLACIMDGNRRWARQRGLSSLLGHKNGVQAIQQAIDFCLKRHIVYLSLYTFSTENFNRSPEERSYLFDVIAKEAIKNLPNLIEQNVRVRFIGDRSLFPESVRPSIDEVEEKTKHLTALNVNFLFCYGARQEIVGGIKNLIAKVRQGHILEDDISEETFVQHLWTSGIPDPDLIIRTGGAVRLSNFLLYQAAYSKLYFLDCFWPDINHEHFQKAFDFFQASKRNFGS